MKRERRRIRIENGPSKPKESEANQMSLYKRNGTYYSDFTVNGQRVRQTLETSDWREATNKERDLMARAREGKLARGMTAEFSRLLFGHAVDRYLEELAVQRPESVRRAGEPRKSWEGDLTNRLRPFFGGKRLNQISADDVRAFQVKRLGQGRNPNTVNHEVKAFMRILRRAKLLSRIRDDIRLLPVKRERREVLTPAEKQRLFETAAREPEWQTAYCAALLTANTSMRPVEIKRLKWADLDPLQRMITVRRSKTEAGSRVIPLNDEAWSAITALKQRADALGTYALECYMLPQLWPVIDGNNPMGRCGWRRAWRSLREEAGKADKENGREAMPRVARLRFYDLRHQFVTELCEAGVPEAVIRELAGHVDPTMMRVYSHPRLAARRVAVEALATVKTPLPEGSYVTNRVTKALAAAQEGSQVIEEVGRGARI
jgi:integrase